MSWVSEPYWNEDNRDVKTEPERAKLIKEVLMGLYDGIVALNNQRTPHQEPGSMADKEQADVKWTHTITTGCSIATLMVESGGEHLTLFGKTITEPVEPLACWTTIRAMLEPCALACWLFDPTIGPEVRAVRVLALQYEGFDEQCKFLRAAKRPPAELDRIKQQIETLESRAVDLGLRLCRNKKGERSGIGMIMPKSTDVIRIMLDMETTYRLLSAVAHGHYWAIIQLGYARPQPQQVVTNSAGVKMGVIEKCLTIQAIGRLAEIAIAAFTCAVVAHFKYVGVDTTPVKALHDEALRRVAEAVNGA